MVRVRIKSDAPLFSAEDYSYIMQCRDVKPRYKILKKLLEKYGTSSKRIYQIWRGEEANRVLWDQPIPHLYNTQSAQAQSIISSSEVTASSNNVEAKPHCSAINHSEVLSDELVKVVQPKMSQRLEAQLLRNSTSSHAVKKSVSSDRDKVTLQSNNASRRKTDLEKLMKDTEKLAPKYPSLSQ